MAETKHTPGPWMAARSPRNVHRWHVAGATGAAICETANWIDTDPVDESAANARLIAAAPEMLAALKVVTLDLNIHAWFAAHDPKALEQVDAAIAKAEGQS